MENQKSLSIAEQVASLKKRGMSLDEVFACDLLSKISYFRLKPYWWDMRDFDTDEDFLPGSDFLLAIQRYDFDRDMRLVLFEAVEGIEIALRTKMINHLSDSKGSLWYLDNSLFENKDLFVEHILDLKKEFNRSKDRVAIEFRESHNWIDCELEGDHPEAWVIFEMATFGTLSKIYKNLKHQLPEKSSIANEFGMNFSSDLSNWFESISVFRNIIAHHSRLWNFRLTKTPVKPKSMRGPWIKAELSQNQKKAPYFTITNMLYLCNAVRPDNHVKEHLKVLFEKYPKVNPSKWGFVNGWDSEPIWR
ncbi:MAG: Abi family protein [Prevotella sp.]|nr:Abi family protein [Prevotella sp.]